MNTSDFRIIKQFKKFILSLNDILIEYPKKEKVLKDKIIDTSYEILELMLLANIKENKKEIQESIISKLSMLDFYFEISLKEKYITEKKCHNLCNELLTITKMVYGWIKNG